MNRKIKYFNKAYREGNITYEKIRQCVSSWIGHAKHGNTYNLRKFIMKKMKLTGGRLYDEKEAGYFNDSRDYDI